MIKVGILSINISDQRRILNKIPNAIPYDRVIETDRAGYLARQYFKANLYDRIR